MGLTVTRGSLRSKQPLAQLQQALQVGDRVGDASRLGGTEPGSLILFEQALERRVGLERDNQERKSEGANDAAVVFPRCSFERQPADVHQRQRQRVGEQE